MNKSKFEVPSKVKEDLDRLREWISQQPHIIARTDDEWLYIFLRGCKYSLQKTKQKIESYYTLQTALPEFFQDRDPLLPNIQEILDLGLFLPLPRCEGSNNLYFFHHCKQADPEKIKFADVLKVFIMVISVTFMEDVNGDITNLFLLCDLEGLSVQHLKQATPSLCKKGITFLKKGLAGRTKGFYFLNSPLIFESTLSVIKPLLGKKLVARVKTYTAGDNRIYDDVPPSIIPKEFGGEGKSIKELTVECKKTVERYRDWFLIDAKYGCDESKRVSPIIYSDLFGIEGSFKQLTID